MVALDSFDQATVSAPEVPHSREAEEAVVGAVFINPDVFHDCAVFLQAENFYIHRHKWIWEAFVRLHEQQPPTPIDLLTVADELEKRGQLAEIGGPAYLTALVNQVPSSLNAESYARIVEGHAVRRRMIDAANKIAAAAYSTETPVEEAIESSWEHMEDAVSSAEGHQMVHAREIMSERYDAIDQQSQMKDEQKPVIRTGLLDLDKYLRIRPGNMLTIAGRPGTGKTGLGLTIATHAADKQKKNVALFTLEMSKEEIGDRLLSQESEVNLFHLMDAKLQEADWPLFTHAVEKLSDVNLFINDNADITVPEIRSWCKKIEARYGLDLVVIDYLGLIEGPGENRTQQVTYISRNIKKMAKALHVPVITLHQMNREIERRGDGEPVLSDLRDSGSVEQDSDTVIFIYIKGEPKPSDKMINVNCSIAKQRNGPKKKFTLAMNAVTTKFENAYMVRS